MYVEKYFVYTMFSVFAVLCTAAELIGFYEECVSQTSVTIKRCDGYFIYNVNRFLSDGAVCTQGNFILLCFPFSRHL